MERWLLEHQRLYDESGKPTAAFWKEHNPVQPVSPGQRMKVWYVSEIAEELIVAEDAAAVALGMARNAEENDRAYSHLSVTRETLYSYISQLEAKLGITQTVAKRF